MGVLHASKRVKNGGGAGRFDEYRIAGVRDTARMMVDLIREGSEEPEVRQLLAQIMRRKKPDGSWAITEKDDKAEAQAIFDWVRANVRYTSDITDVETLQRAIRTVEEGIGDCDDQTVLYGALARAAGFPFAVHVIDTTGEGYEHVYGKLGVPKFAATEWLAVDCTENKPLGWEVPPHAVKKSFTLAVDGDKPDSTQGAGSVTGRGGLLWWGLLLLAAFKLWGPSRLGFAGV